MFERFTPAAHRVVELANQEADRLRHGYLGAEHVLAGIVQQADSPGRAGAASTRVEPGGRPG
jgi:hypothetical protein